MVIRLKKDKNCILCPYKKEENCLFHNKCYSLSNIYYGIIINYFPFKQINDFLAERVWRKENKYLKDMDKKYGNYALETDENKFIWGVKSWDDLTGKDACMLTMNDIDIIYDKKRQKYMLGIETAYIFRSHADECDYLRGCLRAFTKYMDDNGLKRNEPYVLYMCNPCTSMIADSIEELYTNFKIFVDGFCDQEVGTDDINSQ